MRFDAAVEGDVVEYMRLVTMEHIRKVKTRQLRLLGYDKTLVRMFALVFVILSYTSLRSA